MKRLLLTLLIPTLLFYSCEEESAITEAPISEDYELYNLYLDYLNSETLVVHAESNNYLSRFTLQDIYIDTFKKYFPAVNTNLIDGLKSLNSDSIVFENNFYQSNKEIIVEPLDAFITGLDLENGYRPYWESFLAKYGDDAVRVAFSKISYNEEKNRAVYAAAYSVWSGIGSFVYLEKLNGKWQIAEFYEA